MKTLGWECGSVVEYLPSMLKTSGLMTAPWRERKRKYLKEF
jgi:hypothetical protein